MSLSADYRACRALVRAEDRDRYISVLFAPAAKRKHLFALYAFNAEIARVSEQVREPMMGELRLQWWRDAIEGKAAGDVARNPVANVLLDTIKRRNLPHALLYEMIDARAFDFYNEPMESLERLYVYLDSTSVVLVKLALEILRDHVDDSTRNGALYVGRSVGLTGLLRNFAFHAARGKLFVPPLDALARNGVDLTAAVSGEVTGGLKTALEEMYYRASSDFALGEEWFFSAGDYIAAFLPVALVPEYLKVMWRPDYDPFRTRVEISPWKKPWLLWRAARRLRHSGALA